MSVTIASQAARLEDIGGYVVSVHQYTELRECQANGQLGKVTLDYTGRC